MGIRFVHQYFFPDLSSVSQVISQIAFSLAEKGEDVSVICSRNRYDRVQGDSLPARERVGGVDIYRCWGPSFGRGTFVSRILDMASFCILSMCRFMVCRQVDTFVFLTNPPLFPVFGPIIKRIRGGRFVYILMDIYPDILIRAGVIREDSLAARILRRVARVSLSGADTVVVLGEDMRKVAIRSGAIPEKVVTIRNWADPEMIHPVPTPQNRFRGEWGLDGKFVVEYSGNLGVSHSFEDILAVAEELADHDEIRFLFIGGGARYKEVERTVSSKGLGNVVMRPYQDVSDLSHSLSAGDVHYITLRRGFEGLVVPSKAYGIMAAGRPMIYQGDREGEIAQMIAQEEFGIVVAEGDRTALRDGILRLYRDRDMAAGMGMLARRALEEKYSASIGVDEYRKVLGTVNCVSL